MLIASRRTTASALPAYKAGSDLPLISPLVVAKSPSVTRIPGARFAAIRAFKPPAAHAGFVGPEPVHQTVTTEPGLAGFNCRLTKVGASRTSL
jgi:hypothetical protein